MRHFVTMRIDDILFTQGFGSRRGCAALVAAGQVRVAGRVVDDPAADLPTHELVFQVEGIDWPYREHALVLLHKPAGFECSREPRDHPSVLNLLPLPLRRRVQPVGRLDQDTTGLLLLTDDGSLLHRLTSPKHHVAKVYEVTARHPVTGDQVAQLLAGVRLKDDPQPVKAAACEAIDTHHLRMTLTDGRYHQVKRMLAAVGNRVDALHRSAIGPLQLGAALPIGHWRWVSEDEAASLRSAPRGGVPAAPG
jgi:16S rRNA pseudouridine516 synthase